MKRYEVFSFKQGLCLASITIAIINAVDIFFREDIRILKMYTGLKNKEIGEMFGACTSAVNKAALRNLLSRSNPT
ncbi:hypothetical protein [Candidatus Scalindua japonica]|nr:hypothetical protein [Candidatus Scalindua japonica]